MDLLSLIISLVGVGFLLLQAGSCLFKPEHPLSIGFLDLMLAALVTFNVIGVYTGSIVLAPEFGVILLQGTWTVRLFRLALILSGVLPSLAWYRIRKPEKLTMHLATCVLPGLAFGTWAALRVHAINSTGPDALCVFAYDVWFPPLMGWFVVCISFTAALLAPLAAFALRFPDLPDTISHPLWHFLERASFGIALFIVAYLVTENLSRKWRIPSLTLATILGILFGFVHLSPAVRFWSGVVPLSLWFIGWLAMVFSELFVVQNGQPEASALRTAASLAARPFSMKQIRGTLVALSLPAMFLVLVDLFSLAWAPRWLDIGALLLLWLFFAERLVEGALTWFPQFFVGGVLHLPRLKVALDSLASGASAVGRAFKAIFDFFKSGGTWGVTAKLLLLPIAYLILLTIANELFNFKKIVIRDFSCSGCAKDTADDETRGFVTALVNELGQLRADLLPDAIVAQRSGGKDPSEIHLLSAGMDSSAMESVVAKSEDLQVSGLKIPMKIFVDPIQDFVRRFLAIRTIEGSLRYELGQPEKPDDSAKHEKRLTIFANSSTGDSWRVSSYSEGELSNLDCPVDTQEDLVMKLVRRLAFEIAKADPAFRDVGFTSNPAALRYFRQGLKFWRMAESNPLDSNSLHGAKSCFQEAVKIDHDFAAAQYRLGLALQRLLHGDAAIDAFRATYNANPKFLAGKILEAVTFDSYSSYSPQSTAVLNVREVGQKDQKTNAFRIWTELARLPSTALTVSERRSVYFGICQHYLDSANDLESPESAFLPYFYCSRVIQLLQGLPAPLVNDAQERTLEGNALDALGVNMEIHRRNDHEFPLPKLRRMQHWTCNADWIHADEIDSDGVLAEGAKYYIAGSKYSAYAVKYFQQSLDLIPNDTVIQCNLASANSYLRPDDRAPMKFLDESPEIHSNLGAIYESKVWTVSMADIQAGSDESNQIVFFFRSSLREYRRAVELEPDFLDALNGYAYTYWEWRLASLQNPSIPAPLDADAALAESYARNQVHIARQRGRNDYVNDAEDTLVEVLVARGRFHEAVQVTEDAFRNIDAQMINGSDEVRWDAAQANLCAAVNTSTTPDRQRYYDAALQQLQKIRRLENSTEPRLFLQAPDVLDPVRRSAVCTVVPEKIPPPAGEKFIPRKPVYFAGASCSWSGVVGEVHGGEVTDDAMLHVWGGGVDETLNLRDSTPASIVLEASGEPLLAEGTTSYFYARLEDANQLAISRTISFPTSKNPAKPPCNSNGVKLIFDQVKTPPASSPPKSTP
jgi:tetratricopeptide (TPR) repeat protein